MTEIRYNLTAKDLVAMILSWYRENRGMIIRNVAAIGVGVTFLSFLFLRSETREWWGSGIGASAFGVFVAVLFWLFLKSQLSYSMTQAIKKNPEHLAERIVYLTARWF